MHMYIHIHYMYTCIHTYIHIYAYTYMYMLHVCMYTFGMRGDAPVPSRRPSRRSDVLRVGRLYSYHEFENWRESSASSWRRGWVPENLCATIYVCALETMLIKHTGPRKSSGRQPQAQFNEHRADKY